MPMLKVCYEGIDGMVPADLEGWYCGDLPKKEGRNVSSVAGRDITKVNNNL
jgi:hypothetical protein